VNNRSAKLYLFYCSNSLNPAELDQRLSEGIELKVIPLPCSGKIDILYLTKAFESGADGVAVVTCKQGDCHYLEGNLRARKRVEAIDSLLEEIGLGDGRTIVIQVGDGGAVQVARELENFYKRISDLPSEPSSAGAVAP
jgi:F420-non-reducing hydrogenase iron-sulfur subunit